MTWKQPRSIECPEVGDFLHHAQQAGVAARIAAQRARIDGVDIATGRAGDEILRHRLQRREQRFERGLALLDQVQHRAPRRARAEAGEPGQCLGQGFEFAAGHEGEIGTNRTEINPFVLSVSKDCYSFLPDTK